MPRAALVTGASLRIGQAIARDLAAAGWAVALHHHRSAKAAKELAAQISAAGGRAVPLPADLADTNQAQALVPAAAARLGPLGLLVNNAAIFEPDTVQDATPEGWDRHIAINLRAPFFLAQAFARQLPPEDLGCIVNLVDMRVWKLTPHFTSYTVSKAGLWTLTQTLAMALAPRIRVNAIGPGPVLPSARQTPEQFRRQWQSTPLQRGAEPAEIAAALRFILDAPAMTGQMLALDGGQHLPWRERDAGPPDE